MITNTSNSTVPDEELYLVKASNSAVLLAEPLSPTLVRCCSGTGTSASLVVSRFKHLLYSLPVDLRVRALCAHRHELMLHTSNRQNWYHIADDRKRKVAPRLMSQSQVEHSGHKYCPLLTVVLAVAQARAVLDEETIEAIPQYIFDHLLRMVEKKAPHKNRVNKNSHLPRHIKKRLWPETEEEKSYVEQRRQQHN